MYVCVCVFFSRGSSYFILGLNIGGTITKMYVDITSCPTQDAGSDDD